MRQKRSYFSKALSPEGANQNKIIASIYKQEVLGNIKKRIKSKALF